MLFVLLVIVGGLYAYTSISTYVNKIDSENKKFEKKIENFDRKTDSLKIQRAVLKAEYDSLHQDYKRLQDSLKIDYRKHIESYEALELTKEMWDKYYDQL